MFTANRNLILDCDFGAVDDPVTRADALPGIPGAQEHGLFVDIVDEVYIGTEGEEWILMLRDSDVTASVY